jgi:NAD(P)-dependent dehydrogenase (short-subunit alcohol dehydrogenase family)
VGFLDGRVAIITGAARGLGREHALLLAAEGASVVVNDRPDSEGAAREVAERIRSLGGTAVVSTEDVSDWSAGERLIRAATETFGGLDVLVNNAGIVMDRALFNMSEKEWDSVVQADLKGHFVPLRHAAAYWRERAKAGEEVKACVINTSSTSGLAGNPGQANYGAAKAGIAALTVIAAGELGRYGVRVNAIAPAARTRLTESAPGLGDIVAPPEDPERFDEWDPANTSPLVAWLSGADCPVTGCVFYCFGGTIAPMSGWSSRPGISRVGRWTIADIDRELPAVL